VITHHLDQTFRDNKSARPTVKSISQVKEPIQYLLSVLAFVPDKSQADAEAAFQKASNNLTDEVRLQLLSREKLSLQTLSSMLDKLGTSTAPVKERIVRACTTCIRADGQLDVEETELLRTVCEILEVPVPPALQ
jgi:tellurite resistance protein